MKQTAMALTPRSFRSRATSTAPASSSGVTILPPASTRSVT